MLDPISNGLVAGLIHALLAAGLVLAHVAWQGLRATPEPSGSTRALDVVAMFGVLLLAAWLVRFVLAGPIARSPWRPELVWELVPAMLLPVLALVWIGSPIGRVWRALTSDPELARAIGLPVRRATRSAMLASAMLLLAGGLTAAAAEPSSSSWPELTALLAVLAAGGGRLGGAVAFALAAGLAEAAGGLLDPALAAPAGVALLLVLLLRPGRTPLWRTA